MGAYRKPTIDEIEMAIQIAMREEVVKVAREGFPISSWEDGKVVFTSPSEVLAMHDPQSLTDYQIIEKVPPSVDLLINKRPRTFSHSETDTDVLEAISRAKRAIVYMSVDWSGPERKRRKAFFAAIGRLHTLDPYRDVLAYSLNEDVAEFRQRFSSKFYNGKYPLGAGSLFWMEDNKCIDHVLGGLSYAEEILTKTFCI